MGEVTNYFNISVHVCFEWNVEPSRGWVSRLKVSVGFSFRPRASIRPIRLRLDYYYLIIRPQCIDATYCYRCIA